MPKKLTLVRHRRLLNGSYELAIEIPALAKAKKAADLAQAEIAAAEQEAAAKAAAWEPESGDDQPDCSAEAARIEAATAQLQDASGVIDSFPFDLDADAHAVFAWGPMPADENGKPLYKTEQAYVEMQAREAALLIREQLGKQATADHDGEPVATEGMKL